MTDELGLGDGRRDLVALHGGALLQTHGPSQCAGEFCCIHNPSMHPLRSRPLVWRSDCRPAFMERVCEHGIGHPDPDSLAHVRRVLAHYLLGDLTEDATGALEVHSCDGCCLVGTPMS